MNSKNWAGRKNIRELSAIQSARILTGDDAKAKELIYDIMLLKNIKLN